MKNQCESIIELSTTGGVGSLTHTRRKWARCIREAGHAEHHFATWGGAQRWLQVSWLDGDAGIVTKDEVPKNVLIRNDPESEAAADARRQKKHAREVAEHERRYGLPTKPIEA